MSAESRPAAAVPLRTQDSALSTLLRVCASLWGFAIGVALYPHSLTPAQPDQAIGFLRTLNIDARAPLRFAAALTLLTLLAPIVLRPLLDRLAGGRRWAANTAMFSMLASLWFVSMTRELAWVIAIPALALLVCVPLRHFDAQFSRRDVILIPTFAAVLLALIDAISAAINAQVIVAAAIVLVVRLAVALIPRTLPPALCFAAAPLAVALQTQFSGVEQRHSAWLPLLIAIATPFVLRLALRDSPRTRAGLRAAIALVVYPIAAYGYSSATSILAADGKPHVDFFEDAHDVVPAGEMLRGEKPFRDIVPIHGLVSDAVLNYATLRSGPPTIGRVLRVRDAVTRLSAPMMYALGAAVTGSPDAGMLTFFATTLLGFTPTSFRPLFALVALLFLALAALRRAPRWFAWAGGAAVLAAITSIDFGAYAVLTLIVAAFRSSERRAALRNSAIGAGIALVPIVISLAASGILVDIVRVTLIEVATLGPAYALTPMTPPRALQELPFIPEALVTIFDRAALPYVLWVINAVALAVALSLRRRTRAGEAMIALSTFALLTTFSYAERHHVYWPAVFAPLIVAAMFWSRRLSAGKMPALLSSVLLLVIAQPTLHVAIAASLRHSRKPGDASVREIGLPRAAGAFFSARDAQVIDVVNRYASSHLRAGETFFDFTNRALLYFVLDRDCPIRQVEVGFFQAPALQREVIERLERNPRVRFAIVPDPGDPSTSVDGVPNAVRAPLVWQYLEEHFTPDVTEAGVSIWRRK
jgi:hypothetical protein